MQIDNLKKLGEYLDKPIKSIAPIRKFCVDSRLLKEGDIYCALPGNKVHGEAFVESAFQGGAVAAVVSKSYVGQVDERIIFVDDVLETLQILAKRIFKENQPKHVIAITGSLGKTTAKEFLATLLEGAFSVFKTPGNANSQIGLPLAILNGFDHQEVAVLEMGMTHAGQIQKMVSLFPPDIALITKVALVHAANFASFEDIIAAKSEIFLHPHTQIGIYPRELKISCGTCMKKTFSLTDPKADYSLPDFHFPFNEPHLLHNLLAALSVATSLKIDQQVVLQRLSQLTLPEMRMQKVEKKGVLFINDAYNAAPESVLAAFRALPEPEKGRKRIVVLGEMRELGSFSEECHRKIGLEALSFADHLVCYGELCAPMAEVWKQANRAYAHFLDRGKISDYLRNLAKAGDVVLLKGSNSTRMWTFMEEFDL